MTDEEITDQPFDPIRSVGTLANDFQTLGGRRVAADAQRLVEALDSIKRTSRPVAKNVLLADALARAVVANIFEDAGDIARAEAWAFGVRGRAEQLEHEALQAWALYLVSKYRYWNGRYDAAATTLQQAHQLLGRERGSVTAAVHALSARVCAGQGDLEQFGVQTRLAARVRERLVPNDLDDLGGDLTFTHPRQLFYVADAHHRLGTRRRAGDAQRETGKSLRAAQEAVRAYEAASEREQSPSNEAHARFCLAFAQYQLGELDQTAASLAPILTMPVAMRTNALKRSVQAFDRRVRRSKPGEARSELLTALETFQ